MPRVGCVKRKRCRTLKPPLPEGAAALALDAPYSVAAD
jgi:hypothetical protein